MSQFSTKPQDFIEGVGEEKIVGMQHFLEWLSPLQNIFIFLE